MSETLRICKKCLPRESEADYFLNLETYIKNLDDTVRVSQKLYEDRLKKCSGCDKLQNGMCRLCGCFVELRAALSVRKCPDLPPKWEAYRGL